MAELWFEEPPLCWWRFEFAGPPLFGVAFGPLLRFFEAIGLALNSDDLGMVHESIDE